MARAQEFDYFGLTIFFTLLLYVFVLSLFLCLRRSNIKRVLEYRAVHTREPTQEDDFFDQATFSFEFRTDFEHVTQSSLGKGCKFFLLLSRLFCAIFFLSTAVVLNAVEDSHGLYYFTAWNSLMVMSFFICAASCSALSLYWKSKRNIYGRHTQATIKWSYPVRFLGVLTHALFEIAGATAMFVLAFDFLYQREDNPKIWDLLNFTRALTVITLFFELCLNNINIRFDQYPANIAWTLMYLLFVWPAVFAGALVGWPYALLQTRNSHCFLNYAGLFAVNFGFYCLWVLAYRVKKGVFVFFNIGRIGSNFYDPEETNLSDHELHTLHEVVAQHDAGFGGSGTAGSASVRASSLPEGYGYGDEYGDTYAPTSAGYSVPSKSVESPYDSPYGYYDEAQGQGMGQWEQGGQGGQGQGYAGEGGGYGQYGQYEYHGDTGMGGTGGMGNNFGEPMLPLGMANNFDPRFVPSDYSGATSAVFYDHNGRLVYTDPGATQQYGGYGGPGYGGYDTGIAAPSPYPNSGPNSQGPYGPSPFVHYGNYPGSEQGTFRHDAPWDPRGPGSQPMVSPQFAGPWDYDGTGGGASMGRPGAMSPAGRGWGGPGAGGMGGRGYGQGRGMGMGMGGRGRGGGADYVPDYMMHNTAMASGVSQSTARSRFPTHPPPQAEDVPKAESVFAQIATFFGAATPSDAQSASEMSSSLQSGMAPTSLEKKEALEHLQQMRGRSDMTGGSKESGWFGFGSPAKDGGTGVMGGMGTWGDGGWGGALWGLGGGGDGDDDSVDSGFDDSRRQAGAQGVQDSGRSGRSSDDEEGGDSFGDWEFDGTMEAAPVLRAPSGLADIGSGGGGRGWGAQGRGQGGQGQQGRGGRGKMGGERKLNLQELGRPTRPEGTGGTGGAGQGQGHGQGTGQRGVEAGGGQSGSGSDISGSDSGSSGSGSDSGSGEEEGGAEVIPVIPVPAPSPTPTPVPSARGWMPTLPHLPPLSSLTPSPSKAKSGGERKLNLQPLGRSPKSPAGTGTGTAGAGGFADMEGAQGAEAGESAVSTSPAIKRSPSPTGSVGSVSSVGSKGSKGSGWGLGRFRGDGGAAGAKKGGERKLNLQPLSSAASIPLKPAPAAPGSGGAAGFGDMEVADAGGIGVRVKATEVPSSSTVTVAGGAGGAGGIMGFLGGGAGGKGKSRQMNLQSLGTRGKSGSTGQGGAGVSIGGQVGMGGGAFGEEEEGGLEVGVEAVAEGRGLGSGQKLSPPSPSTGKGTGTSTAGKVDKGRRSLNLHELGPSPTAPTSAPTSAPTAPTPQASKRPLPASKAARNLNLSELGKGTGKKGRTDTPTAALTTPAPASAPASASSFFDEGEGEGEGEMGMDEGDERA